MRQSLFWRMLVRLERLLPPVSSGAEPRGGGQGATARRRWVGLAAILPSIAIAVAQVLSHRVDWTAAWPDWQPMLLDLTLIAAGAAVVAAFAVGAHAWRRAHA